MSRKKGRPLDRYIVKVDGKIELVTLSNGEAKRYAYQHNGEVITERVRFGFEKEDGGLKMKIYEVKRI